MLKYLNFDNVCFRYLLRKKFDLADVRSVLSCQFLDINFVKVHSDYNDLYFKFKFHFFRIKFWSCFTLLVPLQRCCWSSTISLMLLASVCFRWNIFWYFHCLWILRKILAFEIRAKKSVIRSFFESSFYFTGAEKSVNSSPLRSFLRDFYFID